MGVGVAGSGDVLGVSSRKVIDLSSPRTKMLPDGVFALGFFSRVTKISLNAVVVVKPTFPTPSAPSLCGPPELPNKVLVGGATGVIQTRYVNSSVFKG